MSDSVVNKLRLQAQALSTDASLYGKMIENNQSSCRPTDAYMVNLVGHQAGLKNLESHALFKSSAGSCLSCDKVLTCVNKCDKL